MPLAQFLLPGEAVRYESSGAVRHGLTTYTLYVTGERLLLYSGGGPLGRKESVVSENLSDIDSLEYTEGGILPGGASLKINFRRETLSLSGEPDVLKDVWRHLQPYSLKPPAVAVDEEATLVTLPEPLFDDQPYPPARVEPIPASAPPRKQRAASAKLPLVLAAACLLALAAAAAVKFGRRPPALPPPAPQQSAALTPTLAPTPAPIKIMDEAFTLEPGTHRAVKFTVPPVPEGARLSGGFRVTAGSYVDFYLMSQRQYDRFAGGAEADVTSEVYRRDQWNARVGERLEAGDYYLVFDNYEGGGGAQTVAAEFTLVFDQPTGPVTAVRQ